MCPNVSTISSTASLAPLAEKQEKRKARKREREGKEKRKARATKARVEIIIRQVGGKTRRRFGLRNVPSRLFIVLSIYLLAGVTRYRVKSKAFTGPCSRVPRQRQRKRKRGARTVEKIRARVWSSEKEIPLDVLFSIFLSLCFSRRNEIEAFQTLGREIAVS